MKEDIKDFFMTGEANELIKPCVEAVQKGYKKPMQEALEFLIENQFVQIPDEDRAWRVRRGSGMELPNSGDVFDIAYLMNDRKFSVNGEIIKNYDVNAYYRYKDDMVLIINNTGSNVPRVWYKLKICAAPFEIKLESIAQDGCIMMDTKFYKR